MIKQIKLNPSKNRSREKFRLKFRTRSRARSIVRLRTRSKAYLNARLASRLETSKILISIIILISMLSSNLFFFSQEPQKIRAYEDNFTVLVKEMIGGYRHAIGGAVYKLCIDSYGSDVGTAFCVQPEILVKEGTKYNLQRTLQDEYKKKMLCNIVYLYWLQSNKTDYDYARTQLTLWRYLDRNSATTGIDTSTLDRLIAEAKKLSDGPDFSYYFFDAYDFSDKSESKLKDSNNVLRYYEIESTPHNVEASIEGDEIKIIRKGKIEEKSKIILKRKDATDEPYFFCSNISQDVLLLKTALPDKYEFPLQDHSKGKGSVQIKKVNINGGDTKVKNLRTKYRLLFAAKATEDDYEYNGKKLQIGDEVGQFVSRDDGYLRIDDLPVAYYDLQEIEAPEGLSINNTALRFKIVQVNGWCVSYQKTTNVNSALNDLKNVEKKYLQKLAELGISSDKELPSAKFQPPVQNGDYKVNTQIAFYDRQKYGFFILKKYLNKELDIDANDAEKKIPEEGAEFELIDSEGRSVDRLITNKDGLAASKLLELGKYKLRQLKSKVGYALANEEEIEISDENEVYYCELMNRAKQANLKIVKIDKETGAQIPIPGVAFSLFKDKENGEAIKFRNDDGSEQTVFVTNADGVAYFPKSLVYGDYYLEEVKSPAGYFLDRSEGRFKISFDDQSILLEGDSLSVDVPNEAQKGQIEIDKTGDFVAGVNEEFLTLREILARKNRAYLAESLQVETKTEQGENLEPEEAEDALPNLDETSVEVPDPTVLENVEKEEAVVEESSLEDGEHLENELEHIACNTSDTKSEETSEVENNLVSEIPVLSESENKPDERSISEHSDSTCTSVTDTTLINNKPSYLDEKYRVVSLDFREDKLEGAEFVIKAGEDIYSKSKKFENGEYKDILLYRKGEEVERFISQATPHISKELPLGKYIVEEVFAPLPFVKNEPIEVELTEPDSLVRVQDESLLIHNRRQHFQVNFKKIFENDERLAGISEEELRTGTAFALFNKNDIVLNLRENRAEVDKNLLIPKDTLIDVNCLDENFKINFETYFPGEYYIRELNTHEAYYLAEDQFVTLDFEKGSSKLEISKELPDIVNEKVEGKIRLHKVSKNTGEDLAGVKFALYLEGADGNKVKQGEYLTNEQGLIEINNLTYGKYYLEESGAKDGYIPLEEAFEIYVNRERDKFDYEVENEESEIFIHKKDFAGEELEGAEMSVLDSEGNIIDSWTSGKEAHRIAKLKLGEKYILKEDLAPLGYATASSIEFTFDKSAHGTKIEMIDDIIRVEIKKIDGESGERLLGAKLALYDSEGKLVDEFVSGDDSYIIEGLKVGEIYCLKEVQSPAGYHKADDIYFKVKDTAEVQLIEMSDIQTRVKINKVDSESKNLLAGAELEIIDSKGEVVTSFTSDARTKTIYGLNIGEKYILREKKAPVGYLLAADLSFTLSEEDKDLTIELENKITKLTINKYDEENEFLAGARFILKDESGAKVAEWTSAESGQVIKGLEMGNKYLLEEISAPDGYAKSEAISFTLDENGEKEINVINIKVSPIAETGESDKEILILALALFMSLVCVLFLRYKFRH